MISKVLWYNKNMHKRVFKDGFTLIELSFAIAFIAILSLAIMLIINDTISSYRRGITLNQINTAGMDLVKDMRAAIRGSSSESASMDCKFRYSGVATAEKQCTDDDGYNFISIVRTATVKVGGKSIGDDVPVFGALCTGGYSYIWNSGYFFNSGDYEVVGVSKAVLSYKLNEKDETITGKLLKIPDDSRDVCVSQVIGSNPSNYLMKRIGNTEGRDASNVFDIRGYSALSEKPIDVLGYDVDDGTETGMENNLAIYDLDVAKPATATTTMTNSMNDLFYSISFILGTIQGGINVKSVGNFCATPADYEVENFDYCAINKFNFAAQATGGKLE